MIASIVCISAGASAGAVLRWGLGLLWNAAVPAIPLGTLAANLLGAYLMGLALCVFDALPGTAPEARLLVMTGFLGGLTTFSTFSAETGLLMQGGQIKAAAALVALHVAGSLLMLFLGMATFTFFKALWR